MTPFQRFTCNKCKKHVGSVPPNWPVPNDTIIYYLKCAEKLEKKW